MYHFDQRPSQESFPSRSLSWASKSASTSTLSEKKNLKPRLKLYISWLQFLSDRWNIYIDIKSSSTQWLTLIWWHVYVLTLIQWYIHIDIKPSSSQCLKPILLRDLTQFVLVCPDDDGSWDICIFVKICHFY